jgi:hypothetical protein
MPDDILLDLVERKQLVANLDAQLARMLADPRASSLVENFATQWLQLQRIEFISPDGALFPGFNQELRAAMLRETELFIESVFREDRSILDLIDADYTFLNEPLARHYGIADTNGTWTGQQPVKPGGRPIQGGDFQRVSLPDRVRGGLLTQASVLTVTSNPTRTSPVKRGRWVLEQILGNPPPPPPPCASAWKRTAACRPVRIATPRWIRSASPWRTSTRSARFARRMAPSRSMRRASSRTERSSTARAA